jgi:hypothetical protein
MHAGLHNRRIIAPPNAKGNATLFSSFAAHLLRAGMVRPDACFAAKNPALRARMIKP